jgi:hypothetical protein
MHTAKQIQANVLATHYKKAEIQCLLELRLE